MDKINGRIENLSNFNKEWLVKEINIVKNDLKNTSNEIFNKIINILNERLLYICYVIIIKLLDY